MMEKYMITDLNKEVDIAFAKIVKGAKKNSNEFFLLLACSLNLNLSLFC